MNSIPHAADRPFAAVLTSIVDNVQEIVRSEVRLAKAEVREEIAGMARGAGWLVAGIVSAFFALSFLLGAGFFALSYIVPHWLAASIIGGILTVICGVSLAARGSIVNSTIPQPVSLSATQSEEITA